MNSINYQNLRVAKSSAEAINKCNSALIALNECIKDSESDYQKSDIEQAKAKLTQAIDWISDALNDSLYNIEIKNED